MTIAVDVRQRVLQANEAAAAELRARFAASGTLAVNLISSPGAGKTTLLESTLAALRRTLRVAALVGDIATQRDAERLRTSGVPARQILTGGACHLDARQLLPELDAAGFGELDVLFVENVGNLICPTAYDLGEDFKVALLSVTEGADKPFKYPAIFARADVTLITKIDLLPHVRFDLEEVLGEVRALRPGGRVLCVSSHTGAGFEDWCDLLQSRAAAKRELACAVAG